MSVKYFPPRCCGVIQRCIHLPSRTELSLLSFIISKSLCYCSYLIPKGTSLPPHALTASSHHSAHLLSFLESPPWVDPERQASRALRSSFFRFLFQLTSSWFICSFSESPLHKWYIWREFWRQDCMLHRWCHWKSHLSGNKCPACFPVPVCLPL